MVRVAVGDHDGVNLQRCVVGALPVTVARCGMAREELVVPAVDEDDLPVRCFENQPISLLDVNHRHAEDPGRPRLRRALDSALKRPGAVAKHPDACPPALLAKYHNLVTEPERELGP